MQIPLSQNDLQVMENLTDPLDKVAKGKSGLIRVGENAKVRCQHENVSYSVFLYIFFFFGNRLGLLRFLSPSHTPSIICLL